MNKLLCLVLFLSVMFVGCSKSDVGFFGAEYIAADAKYRHYSLNYKKRADHEKNTLLLYDGEKMHRKYPPYLMRGGRLYLLFRYGQNGNIRFHYPSKNEIAEISMIFNDIVNSDDPCLGVEWLKRDVKMQVSRSEDERNYREMADSEQAYVEFVNVSAGGFCDQTRTKKM